MAESFDGDAAREFLDIVMPGVDSLDRTIQTDYLERELSNYINVGVSGLNNYYREVRLDCAFVHGIIRGFDGIPTVGGWPDYGSLSDTELEGLLEQRTGPGAIERARLTELEEQIRNWSGSDNDPILDQLIRERNELIAALAPGVNPSDIDERVLAVAVFNSLTYDEALFAVTAERIDGLTARIDPQLGGYHFDADKPLPVRNAHPDHVIGQDLTTTLNPTLTTTATIDGVTYDLSDSGDGDVDLANLAGWDDVPDHWEVDSMTIDPAEWYDEFGSFDSGGFLVFGGEEIQGSTTGVPLPGYDDLPGAKVERWDQYSDRMWTISNSFQQTHTLPSMEGTPGNGFDEADLSFLPEAG